MKNLNCKIIIVLVVMLVGIKANGQTTMPAELTTGSIKEQINYIEQNTRIYENYRAIREDMFRKINRNFVDSLAAGKSRIAGLNNLTSRLSNSNDSLRTLLDTTRRSLEETTRTKNSITVFGMGINKATYNSFMWVIVAILVAVLVVGFLVFKRNLYVTMKSKKEFRELKEEFESYRQSARVAREKMSMDHFNEIKKLKGL